MFHVNKKDLFLACYAIYILNQILSASQFVYIEAVNLALSFSRYALFSFFAVFAIYNTREKMNGRKTFLILCAFVMAILNMLFANGGISFLLILLIVIGYYPYPLKKIFHVTFFTAIIGCFIVLGACKVGILTDTVNARVIGNISGSFLAGEYYRHNMGFLVQNQMPFFIMYCYLYLVAIRKQRITMLCNILVGLLNFWSFMMFGSRVAFALTLGTVLLYCVVKYWSCFSKIVICENIWKIFMLAFPAACLLSFIASIFYGTKQPIMIKLDTIFNNRFRLASEALDIYGMHFLGSGKNAGTYHYIMSNTVDNGYMLLFIQYGYIIGIFVMMIWAYLTYVAGKQRNIYLLLVLGILAIANLVDSHIMSCMMIPFYCIFLQSEDSFIRVE